MGPSPIFSVDSWVLVGGSAALFGGVAVATRLVAHRTLADDDRTKVLAIVGPLTPALAALFAVMVAFTVVNEAGYLRAAQSAAGSEASAAGRLAWAATSPGVDDGPIQTALVSYLRAITGPEWSGTFESDPVDGTVTRRLQQLEAVTRDAATRPGLTSAVSAELLAALDGITVARRDRLSEASRGIPGAYLGLLVVAGLALVVNVALLTLWWGHRGLVLVMGVAAVVALALALLIGISAPFAGALTVDHTAIDAVVVDLRSGFFAVPR